MIQLLLNLVRHLLRPSAPETDEAPPVRAPAPRSEAVRDMIVPMIKVVEERTDVEIAASGIPDIPVEQRPVSRPLGGDLVTMYAVDYPERFEYVSQMHLEREGISEEELHALACRNLQVRAKDIQVHGSYPRFMVTAGGNFEASLLHHEDFWRQVVAQIPLQGEIHAIVPSRDMLVFTDSGTEGAMEFLKGMLEKDLEDTSHALSKLILALRQGQWVVA